MVILELYNTIISSLKINLMSNYYVGLLTLPFHKKKLLKNINKEHGYEI